MHCYFLLDELIKISPTGEIHSQPMRQALLKVLQEHPEVNDTKYNGQVWMNIKSERLNVILSHCRRLKVQSSWGSCAAKLTGAEYQLLQKLIQGMSGKVVLDEPPKKRVLKKEESDISIDENGFPNILKTPEPKEATVLALEDAKPEAVSKGVKRPLTKRLGQRAKANIEKQRGQKGKSMAAKKKTKKKKGKGVKEPLPKRLQHRSQKGQETEEHGPGLKSMMGIQKKKDEKPLSKRQEMKRPSSAASQHVATSSGSRLPWAKIRITRAKNPERSYITGTKDPDCKKLSLIVEISKKRHTKCHEIIDIIFSKLKEENLTKDEALALREQLCWTLAIAWPLSKWWQVFVLCPLSKRNFFLWQKERTQKAIWHFVVYFNPSWPKMPWFCSSLFPLSKWWLEFFIDGSWQKENCFFDQKKELLLEHVCSCQKGR